MVLLFMTIQYNMVASQLLHIIYGDRNHAIVCTWAKEILHEDLRTTILQEDKENDGEWIAVWIMDRYHNYPTIVYKCITIQQGWRCLYQATTEHNHGFTVQLSTSKHSSYELIYFKCWCCSSIAVHYLAKVRHQHLLWHSSYGPHWDRVVKNMLV